MSAAAETDAPTLSAVLERSESKRSRRLLLASLAVEADRLGVESFPAPSLEDMVRWTALSERTVREALRELVAAGEVVVEARYSLPRYTS